VLGSSSNRAFAKLRLFKKNLKKMTEFIIKARDEFIDRRSHQKKKKKSQAMFYVKHHIYSQLKAKTKKKKEGGYPPTTREIATHAPWAGPGRLRNQTGAARSDPRRKPTVLGRREADPELS
jgi:hypothetical protein